MTTVCHTCRLTAVVISPARTAADHCLQLSKEYTNVDCYLTTTTTISSAYVVLMTIFQPNTDQLIHAQSSYSTYSRR